MLRPLTRHIGYAASSTSAIPADMPLRCLVMLSQLSPPNLGKTMHMHRSKHFNHKEPHHNHRGGGGRELHSLRATPGESLTLKAIFRDRAHLGFIFSGRAFEHYMVNLDILS